MVDPTHEAVRVLRCMEIWGGYEAVQEHVSTPGLDGWIYCRPHDGAVGGGDVHYLSLCGGGLVTRLILADVSGHGAAVAAFARSLRSLMRRHINRKDQAAMVRALNREFTAQAQFDRFATAVVATYLANDRSLTVCNAGHPRPLYYSHARREWTVLHAANVPDARNLPLGFDERGDYSCFRVVLAPGDRVVVYTDALVEAEGADGRMLGEDGLLTLARELPDPDAADLGARLLDGVERFREGRPADDDVTILTLRHNATGPRRLRLGEHVDVLARVLGLKPV